MTYPGDIIRGSGGGGKGGGGKGRPAQEDADTLHSSQHARILDAISEGEVEGLANGERGIYLDETPLMAEDGSYNFENVTVGFREGSQFQEYMPGFGGVESSTQVGLTINKDLDTCPPQVIHQANMDAIRVTVACMNLTTQDKENGDIHGSKVEFEIYLKYGYTGSWVKRAEGIFEGKTTKKYTRTYRLELGESYELGEEVWIRIDRITDKPEDSSEQNEITFESYTTVIDNKLSYPNTSYIGLAINAKQFQSIPKRAYDIKGIKVKLPSNYNGYDPETLQVGDNLYEGHWDGQLTKLGWTSNPAWIFYDLVTNERYGLGGYIKGTQIDKWTLYQVARYCDSVNEDGDFVGVKTGFRDAVTGEDMYEPRFAMNLYIQQQQEAIKVIQDIAFAFRGLVYWAAGQLVPVQDAPKTASKLFSAANVIDGAFQYTGTAQKARKTVALVSWNDPEDMYRAKMEYVEDREGIDRYGIRKTSITSFGCTSRGQAHRIGLWTLFTNRLETELLAFKTGIEAAALRPGDLVLIADPTRAGKRLGGRTKVVEESSKTRVYLDVPFTPTGGVDYTLNILHSEEACVYPQETSPGVPHHSAGQMYSPSNPHELVPAEACISDGGQWNPYLFNESYKVEPTPYEETEYLEIPAEDRIATEGTGLESNPFSIYDSSANFTEKYLGRSIENSTTGDMSTVSQIISPTELHVEVTGFASEGDLIKYHHALSYLPKADFMYLLEEVGVVDAQEWRVLGVAEVKKNEFAVTCMEYQEDKYRIIEERLDFEELDSRHISSIPNTLKATPPPADVDIDEALYKSSDSSLKNKMVVSWREPDNFPYIRDYLVQYKPEGGNWVTAGVTEFTTLDILDVPAGTYTVRIRGTSVLLNKSSSFTKATKTLLGLVRPPASVTQYCAGYSYARTALECTSQGACSQTDAGFSVNSQSICEGLRPLDPDTGVLVADEDTCVSTLGHAWVGGVCQGRWQSDGNTWETNNNNFVGVSDFKLGTSLRWEPVPDLDLAGYELQQGPTWVSPDALTSIDVLEGGVGYSVGDSIAITSTTGGSGAVAEVLAVDVNGSILTALAEDKMPLGTKVIVGGSGYKAGAVEAVAANGTGAVFDIGSDNVGCCKCRCVDNKLLIRENSLSFGIDGGYYLPAGVHTFMVKAVDNSGIYSEYVAEVSLEVSSPDPVTNLTYSFVGGNVLLEWEPPVSSFYAVKDYDYVYGNAWDSESSTRVHVSSNNASISVNWGGTRTYWVTPEDLAGNLAVPVSVEIEIFNPGWSTSEPISHNINKLGVASLSWEVPTEGSLPISNYELRYGGSTGDTATLIGLVKTTTYSEQVSWGPTSNEPIRVFWVRAIDSAGNMSEWQHHQVEIRDPLDLKTLDYSLIGPDQVTTWTSQGVGDEAYDENIEYLLPVAHWEVRRGANYSSAFVVSATKSSPRYSEKVEWGDGTSETYWVTPMDSAGNKGPSSSLLITVNNPSIPSTVSYSISGNTATISWVAPSADLDIVEYELRSGATWDFNLDGSGNMAITKALTLNHTLNVNWRPYDPDNNIDDIWFFVRAIDSAGNYSDAPVTTVHPEGLGYTHAKINQLGQVINLRSSFVGIMVLLTWTAPTLAGDALNNYLPVDFYEIRDATGAVLKTTKSTSYSTPVDWGAGLNKEFTVVAKDMGGNYGVPVDIDIAVTLPDAPSSLNTTAVDNNVLIRWPSASNPAKLDIISYEVRRCPDGNPSCSSSNWEALSPVSSTAGMFISHLETTGGAFKYWLRATDSAGNVSEAISSIVLVSEPPDFILKEDRLSTLDVSAPSSYEGEETTIETTGIHKGAVSAFLPVDDSETWSQHFTTNGYNSPQEQVDAGFEYFLEPSQTSADFWQKWDLEVLINPSSIQVGIGLRLLTGTVIPSTTIYYSDSDPDGTSLENTAGWNTASGSSTMAGQAFRYLKVHTAFSTSDGGLAALDEYRVKISLKNITDSGTTSILGTSGLCNELNSGEEGAPMYYLDELGLTQQPDNDMVLCLSEGGSWYPTKDGMKVVRVFFNKPFKDINYLNTSYKTELDGEVVPSRFTIYDFEDVPSPSFFYAYILDKNDYGSISDPTKSFNGILTWNSRGVQ